MNAVKLPFEKKTTIPIDPRTKILLTVSVSTIMMAGGTGGIMNIVRPCLFMLPMLLLMLSKKWKTVTRFLITYALLFALEITVLPMLKGTWNFILGGAVGIYTHILPGFVMGYYMIESTTVSEFVAAMKRMRISEKIVIPLSVVFRFFPTVKEEYHSINYAMKMRGIEVIGDPMKMLEYRIVPLMVSVAKIGEELSAAALTRGLGSPIKRTNICNIGFGVLDIVLISVTVLCWIGYIIA